MISGKIEFVSDWQEPAALVWWVMVVSIFWSQYSKLMWLSLIQCPQLWVYHNVSASVMCQSSPGIRRGCCSTISACSTDAGCLQSPLTSVTSVTSCTHSPRCLVRGLLLTRVQTVMPGLACYHHPGTSVPHCSDRVTAVDTDRGVSVECSGTKPREL